MSTHKYSNIDDKFRQDFVRQSALKPDDRTRPYRDIFLVIGEWTPFNFPRHWSISLYYIPVIIFEEKYEKNI